MKVVAGIIILNNKVLIARRAQHKSMAGKWEFPGGKVEPGEQDRDALEREIFEEFGVRIRTSEFLGSNRHDYGSFTIDLYAYYALYLEGDFLLTDHDRIEWVTKEEIHAYDMAEADEPFAQRVFSGIN